MRVLLVSHRSLPRHPAGTEVHTHSLARALVAAGHEVLVYTAEKDVSRRHMSLNRREHDGVRYVELVNNLFHESFEQTYRSQPAEVRFGEVLDAFRPDVVHAAHLLYHSIGYAAICEQLDLPFFMTLFDFWLMCPRFGQRRYLDGSLCATIEPERCARCMAGFKHAATATERRVGRALAGLRGATGVDLAPLAKRVAAGSAAPTGSTAFVEPELDPRWLDALAERERAMREELVPRVAGFVAPSHFLESEFLAWGLPAGRTHFLRTGIDLLPFEGFVREPRAERLRVRFIGTVVAHKGPQVLVEAFERLEPSVREKLQLDLHGPGSHAPELAADLERRAAALGARYHGALERAGLAATLARTDLLVVPSLWYENAPLVILEALATGTAVAVSDLGGMAELVRESEAGFAFRAGDATALAELIAGLASDPERVIAVAARGRGALRSIDEDARDFAALYDAALAR
ncbi:Glycogen synthase [Planctomycetes bacterium Pla163]|uniref:Glycogen synthase n=1 Tax=Rohdeia mirabilis TaxID=2528008 RepID=A0A518CYK3_9BACT|nr:Glycogen synthase [Planctomycetes bacterium Pla163]